MRAAPRAVKRLALAASALTALCGAALADVPLKILPPAVPSSPVFGYLPGGTLTNVVLSLAMVNNVRAPVGTVNPTTGTFTPWGLDGVVPTAANNLALSAYFGNAATMRRLGHDAAGDTVPVDYTLVPGPCPIPGGDGGSQIPRALGGCWTLNPPMRVPLSLWAGKGSADVTAALNAALAYLGAQGGPRMLWADLPGSTSTAPRITIPQGVTVSGDGFYEGGDTANMPIVTFTDPNGGFACGKGAGIHGLALAAGNAKVDHLVELTGQCGLDHYRLSYTVNGVAMTRTLAPGQSTISLSGALGSGLANGSYSGVPFTGGGGGGATLNVAVNNGAITNAVIATGGTGYAPWFDFGFAAGALYPGSPAIQGVGQIGTANPGRTKITHGFQIAGPASKTGIEIDGAYDYITAEDVEIWNPSVPSLSPGSIGIRLGHVDGASIISPKLFGMETGISWGGAPTTVPQSFVAITSPELDFENIGISITFPGSQLSITGGYARTIGKALFVNAPSLHLTASGTDYLVQSDAAMSLLDFAAASITGNNFHSDNQNTVVPEVVWGNGAGTMIGTGLFAASGNVFDGSHPAFLEDVTGKGGTIGANRWPNRQYAFTDANGNPTRGYFTQAGQPVDVDPIRSRQIGVTADAKGYATWTHSIGSQANNQSVILIGACAAVGYQAAIVGLGPDSVTFIINQANGQPAPNAQCQALVKA